MLALASLLPGETVFDLGSGDGRVVIAAARDFHAKAVGVEIRVKLARECRRKIRELGLANRASILCRNFKKVSLRKADVLALYLSSYTLNLLCPKFEGELRPGARIVTFDFRIPGRSPARVVRTKPAGWKTLHPIFLYVM